MRTNQTILGHHIIIFKIPTSPRQHPNNSSSATFRCAYSLLIMPLKTHSNASHKPRAGDVVLPTPSHSQDTAIGDVSEPQPKSKTTKRTSGKHAYATGSDMEANPTKKRRPQSLNQPLFQPRSPRPRRSPFQRHVNSSQSAIIVTITQEKLISQGRSVLLPKLPWTMQHRRK
jgi:hypothetical protein